VDHWAFLVIFRASDEVLGSPRSAASSTPKFVGGYEYSYTFEEHGGMNYDINPFTATGHHGVPKYSQEARRTYSL